MEQPFSHWYERRYPFLSGKGLWLRGGEMNTLPAADYVRLPYRVLIARMSTYRDAAVSFTHKVLYQITRSVEGVFPDLAWLPPPRDAAIFDADNVPWLLGTNCKQGPLGFDLVAFSNAVVQELINLPAMLAKSGIPIGKKARMSNAAVPLIILGGANALGTAALFTADPPVDGIFAGGNPDAIRRLFDECRRAKAAALSKQEIVARLRDVPGFVEPDRPAPVRIQGAASDIGSLLAGAPVMYDSDQIAVGNIPISEGCRCQCSFCLESWTHKPYLEFDADAIVANARAQKAAAGLFEAELFSFNFNMHSGIYEVLLRLLDDFAAIGLKSQRFDVLAHDPQMLKVLHALGKTSLTCGIEGISARLRRYLNKGLSDSDLTRALSAVVRAPMRQIKIFLIATGHEEDEDIAEFKHLLSHIKAVMASSDRHPRMIFSCTPLVRFPLTPIEFADTPPVQEVQKAISAMTGSVRSAGFEFRLAASVNEMLVSQLLVRSRDARVFECLVDAVQATGFIYNDTVTDEFAEAFFGSLRKKGLVVENLLAAASENETTPWQNFDIGICPSRLREIYNSCVVFKEPGDPSSPEKCAQCGVCVPAPSISSSQHESTPSSELSSAIVDKIHTLKASEQTVRLLVDVGAKARGVPRDLVAAALASAIMRAQPGLITGHRGFRTSHFVNSVGMSWLVGHDIFDFRWLKSDCELLNNAVSDPRFVEHVNSLADGWVRLLGPWRLTAAPSPSFTFLSPWPLDEHGFLSKHKLKFTRTRSSDNTYRYGFSADSLKKKIVREMTTTDNGDGTVQVHVLPDKKFDPQEFMETGFCVPNCSTEEWVRIEAIAEIQT